MLNKSAATAASILAAVVLSACGSETVDAGDLEQELADQLSPQAGVDPADVSVDCPEDQEIEQGSTFQCTLVAPNGDDVQVDVKLTDEEGGFEAEVPPQQFK